MILHGLVLRVLYDDSNWLPSSVVLQCGVHEGRLGKYFVGSFKGRLRAKDSSRDRTDTPYVNNNSKVVTASLKSNRYEIAGFTEYILQGSVLSELSYPYSRLAERMKRCRQRCKILGVLDISERYQGASVYQR